MVKYKIRRTFAEKGKIKVKKSTLNTKKKLTKEEKFSNRAAQFRRIEKGVDKVGSGVGKRFNTFSRSSVKSRKILRQGPRPTLDLRRRFDREVPVKQHGFKEDEIQYGKIL